MKKKKIIKVIICLIVVCIIYITASLWASANFLVVNDFTYQHAQAGEDIKLVVISDQHGHTFGEENDALVQKIREQNPDLILMVGDFIDSDTMDVAFVSRLVGKLTDIAPVYFAWGNHELSYIERTKDTDLAAKIIQAGAVILDKSYVDLNVKGVSVRLGGLYDYAFGGDNVASEAPQDIADFLMDFGNTKSIKIMMSHRPDSFYFGDASEYWNVDLVITGHNHGGQVVLPFVGGLYGGDQGFFPEIDHGMFVKNDMHIFATSGLGSHKQLLPRFNNPPEIAVITLTDDQ